MILRALETRPAEERFVWNLRGRLGQRCALLRRFVGLAGASQRDAAREVPPRDFHRMIRRRRRQRENLVVAAEAQEHGGLHRDERLDHRHHLRVRRHLLGHFGGGLARRGQPSPHHLRVGEEVQVVGEVREPVEAVRRRDLEVLAVGLLRPPRWHGRRRPGRRRARRCARACASDGRRPAPAYRAASRSAARGPAWARPPPCGCSSGWRRGDSDRAPAPTRARRRSLRCAPRACRRATRASTRAGSSGSRRTAWRRRDRRGIGATDRAWRRRTCAPAPRGPAWHRSET